MSALQRLRAVYGRLLYGCGLVAGAVVFLMMLLVVANAVGRYVFNAPINGTLEITESMLTVLVFLSLALTQYEGGHIHVVLLVKTFSPFWQKLAIVVALVLGAILFAWSSYAVWTFAMKSYVMDEHEWGAIQFPLYPVKFVSFVGLLLLTIQFVIDAVLGLMGHFPEDEVAHVSPEGEAV